MIYALDGEAPEINESAWVAPSASVIGRVRLLAEAGIWFGCTLRGDEEWIEVGHGSNVQDGSVLHTDKGAPLIIGSGVTIGHKVILHGCRISDDALVGMGSTILNHASIGSNTIIGAGSLIAEGKEIPAGVLALGAPARVKRDLTDAEINLVKWSAQHYVTNAARFKSGLDCLT